VHALTILCPIDYSDCSKRALRFGGALAEHFGARLVILHVFDPLVAGTAALHDFDLTGADGRQELESFIEDALSARLRAGQQLKRVLVVGSPGGEIVKMAHSHDADLLVMGTHGFSGARKFLFGSTLQGVLRRARIPVLAVPLVDHRRTGIQAPLVATGPVLAPVDFSPESRSAARAAAGLARALHLPLLVVHVIASPNSASSRVRSARGTSADPAILLAELAAAVEPGVSVEVHLVDGEPAEQIARLAREKRAALVVMSLGSSAMRARHRKPGSVAYRVLCLAPAPVLALPGTSSGRAYVQYLDPTAASSAPAPHGR
jgi:nucleotide-binding universal stress UspA family protein